MGKIRVYINEKHVKKDGAIAIYVMAYIGGKSIKFNTGVAVPLEKFDPKKGIIKGKSKDDTDNNLIIENCISRINEIQVRYRLQNKELTPDLLRREYKNPTYYVDFYTWMDEKLKDRVKNKEISAESEKPQRVLLNKLKGYKKNLAFADIDLKFIQKFRNHLRQGLKNDTNTVRKNLVYFRTYMNIAVRDEIITHNPFDNFSFTSAEPLRVFLTEKELKTLIECYDSNRLPYPLHRTLRHFLFMCLTGLRISDFKRLRHDHIQENVLKFTPHKTRAKKRQEIFVPLVKKAQQLISDEETAAGLVFNTISEQKMRDQVKDIMKRDDIKINKDVTIHSARHTFATLFLEKTSDVATLQKLLGHSNIRETMMYVHLSNQKITDQMGNFDRLLKL